jgi:5'-deoxynucleotidase
MPHHFFAFISRMKYINRWGLMRNTRNENISEHSLEVAIITHALCVIANTYFNASLDQNKAALIAIFIMMQMK